MEYKVMYRKYRPATFDELVGQDFVTNILKKAIMHNKLSHAYLFTGPRGTGKTSAAKIFSKAINCLNSDSGNPCGECEVCKKIEENADIIEIDAASNNGVDEIRELRNNVKVMPTYGKYKIYIIDEVHMLSTSAFNALLKTLEEPPEHIIFILATTDVQKIPLTVISRCQRFDFKKISISIISQKLAEICDKEQIKYDKESLDEISFMADGALRDALGILDQLSTTCNGNINIKDVQNIYKTVTLNELKKLFEAIENNESNIISSIIKELSVSGVDCNIIIVKLVEFLLPKAELIKVNPKISRLTFDKIKNLIFDLNKLLYESRTSINSYILLEIVILSILDENTPKKDLLLNEDKKTEIVNDSITPAIEQKNEELEDSERQLTKENLTELENVEIRINNCMITAQKELKNNFSDSWEKFVVSCNQSNIKIYSLIIDTEIVASSKEYSIVVAQTESQAALFNSKYKTISKEFSTFTENNVILAAISKSQWLNKKNQYCKDMKKNIKWEWKNEKSETVKPKKKSKIEKISKDIFSDVEIEIK